MSTTTTTARAAPAAPAPAPPSAVSRKCSTCDAEVGQAKFCPECGTPAAPPRASCSGCGHQPEGSPKFCPECGGKMK